MDKILHAFSFDPEIYPDSNYKSLNKAPLDTLNRVKSAISRFSEIKTPSGEVPSDNVKTVAWSNIMRASKLINYNTEIETWEEIEPNKVIKNINDKGSPFLVKFTRASKQDGKLIIAGTASSTLYDDFGSKCSKECLENLAAQINYNNENGYDFIILGSNHNESYNWDSNLGKIISAYVKFDGNDIYSLEIKAEIDKDHPMGVYLYKIIQRSLDADYTFPIPYNLGFSIDGTVVEAHYNDWDGSVISIEADYYKEYLFDGMKITIDRIQLGSVSVVNVPSNPLSSIHSIIRQSIDISLKRDIKRGENMTLENINVPANTATINEPEKPQVEKEIVKEETVKEPEKPVETVKEVESLDNAAKTVPDNNSVKDEEIVLNEKEVIIPEVATPEVITPEVINEPSITETVQTIIEKAAQKAVEVKEDDNRIDNIETKLSNLSNNVKETYNKDEVNNIVSDAIDKVVLKAMESFVEENESMKKAIKVLIENQVNISKSISNTVSNNEIIIKDLSDEKSTKGEYKQDLVTKFLNNR